MMETNTASCGGFPGLSDSFGAALWGLDFSLQMAFTNFSGAMMHVGGQNVYYNVRHFLSSRTPVSLNFESSALYPTPRGARSQGTMDCRPNVLRVIDHG